MKIVKLKDYLYSDRSRYNWVRKLQRKGKLKTYDVDGYVAYDEDEFETYKSTPQKYGRPQKRGKSILAYTVNELINANDDIYVDNEDIIKILYNRCRRIVGEDE